MHATAQRLALALLVSHLPNAGWTGTVSAQSTGSVYRHPTGFVAQLPPGWRVQKTPEALHLVPPDAAADAAGQPLEFFVLGRDDAEGIYDPGDPSVVAYFQQELPGMRAVGPPERVVTAMGPGAVLTFEGSMGGPPLRQRSYVVLYEGMGIYLAHLALAEISAGRDDELRQIFQSFSWGATLNDPSLVGGWFLESSNVNSGSSYSSSSMTRRYVLAGDGSVRYRWQSSISVDVEGMSSSSISDPETWTGRWAAGDGELFMYFDNGEELEYQYAVVRDSSGAPVLKLVDGSGTVEYYRFQGR